MKKRKNVCMFAAGYMKRMVSIKRNDMVNIFITYVLHFPVLFFRLTLLLYMQILISRLYNSIVIYTAEVNIDYKRANVCRKEEVSVQKRINHLLSGFSLITSCISSRNKR
jgi:hypothetical protein